MKNIFSIGWFKTKKQKETLNELKIEEQMLKNELLEKKLTGKPKDKLYKNMKFVNNVLTVILNDGSLVVKSEATADDFNNVRSAFTEEEIIAYLYGKKEADEIKVEKKEEEKQVDLYNDVQFLTSFPDFEMNEEAVYMNGIDSSLPPLLVEKFAEIIGRCSRRGKNWEDGVLNDPEYIHLKKFWLKCCLNPNAQSAEDLYTFLTHHNMKIDRHGNFFAYRRVQKVNDECFDSGLVDAISNAYNKVKAVWKKNPADYTMGRDDNGDYSIYFNSSSKNWETIGNLKELYLNLPNMQENRYTDAHTGTMDYRVGQIASIPRNLCDDNNRVNCGAGLHAASKKYDYTGFGDTPVLMIINPMDAVSVPINEVGKLRVARWFFAMTLDEKEKYILDEDDFDVTELGDIFEEQCLADMEEHVHNSFAEEVKRHTYSIPKMSHKTIKSIVNTLEDMRNAISSRVVRK